MRAVLLAAGRGTRLAPLTDTTPKALAPLGGRPLLAWQLAWLAREGVTEVAVNVHHLQGRVLEFLEREPPPIPVRVSYEPVLLGTAGALLPLRDFLTGPFLVHYADVVTDARVGEHMAAHERSGAVATLTYHRADETFGKGVLSVDAGGRVTGFREKDPSDAGPGLVNSGIYAADPSLLDLITPERTDFGHHVWPAALAAGLHLDARELGDAYLRDIGSLEALEAAERDLEAGLLTW